MEWFGDYNCSGKQVYQTQENQAAGFTAANMER